MTFVATIDCPFCKTKSVGAVVENLAPRNINTVLGYQGVLTGPATCNNCGEYVILIVEEFIKTKGQGFSPINTPTQPTNIDGHRSGSRTFSLTGWYPETAGPKVPDHLPENVHRAFLSAEKDRSNGSWTSAAMQYGKAIDRGITPLLTDTPGRLTLGQKLGKLRDRGELPQPLLDWIGVALKDRNFASHDDDKDFDSEEEIATIRDLATILLTYLYTMPKRVEIAREDAARREGQTNST
ncbi:DUF4145 domain-containing protein [Phaeobacter sp. CNT1-3]|nr:DUF4145 domain-containing protein [Phaeobacter sp. CNT1-3]